MTSAGAGGATPRSAPLAVVAATVAVSFSAIFIRLAQAPAATVVWVRMALATALLLPWLGRDLFRGALPRGAREWAVVGVGGGCLAVHFLAWTASLGATSVASSVLLVSLHPVVVAVLGRRILDERTSMGLLVGIALCLAGTAVTTGGDVRLSGTAWRGDLLALLAAASFAVYVVAGRGLRRSTGTAGYSVPVYAMVAAVALLTAAGQGDVVPSPRAALACLGLAAVCTVGGHTVFAWALRHLRATVISAAFLGEPPLTVLLAIPILGERPTPQALVGGAVILAGLGLVLADRAGEAPAAELAEVAAAE